MSAPSTDPWTAARRTVQWHIGAALIALVASLGLVLWAWWSSRDGGDHAFAGGFGVFFTCVTALALSLYVSASRRVRDARRRGLWQTLATTLVLIASAAPLTRRAPVFLVLLALLAALEVWVLLDRIRAIRRASR
jgi:uncharacterized membrane protein YhaH (DUF805 family)